jgi:hypothetical protein
MWVTPLQRETGRSPPCPAHSCCTRWDWPPTPRSRAATEQGLKRVYTAAQPADAGLAAAVITHPGGGSGTVSRGRLPGSPTRPALPGGIVRYLDVAGRCRRAHLMKVVERLVDVCVRPFGDRVVHGVTGADVPAQC